jgi:SAM-dependent methyltransferase
MREAWEAQAPAWIEWARSPDLARAFWRFHLPRFLEVVPPPGRLTIEIGCGEGRLGRELARVGHRVVGLDPSPALVEAAVSHPAGFPAVVGDAAALPFQSEVADLLVSMMSLQNVERMEESVAEAARVLERGGSFCIATPHPFKVASDAGAPYFETFTYHGEANRQGIHIEFPTGYRPLSSYFNAIEQAGLTVATLREPQPDADFVRDQPAMARCLEVPCLLLIVARKP